MPDEDPQPKEDTRRVISAYVPVEVAEAIKGEAERQERSVSWGAGKILEEHFRENLSRGY